MADADIICQQLQEPFPSSDIEWRAGSTNKEKTRALALAYITSRAVMDRLDSVVGIGNWHDSYRPGPAGGVMCSLSLCVDGQWVTKEDGAENTDREPIKGGISDAFKRAAVKWGIGRYLYELPQQWVEAEPAGNSVRLKGHPKLPDWALPDNERGKPQKAQVERPEPNGQVLNGTSNVNVSALNRTLKDMSIASPKTFIAKELGVEVAKVDSFELAAEAIVAWASEEDIDDPVQELIERASKETADNAGHPDS